MSYFEGKFSPRPPTGYLRLSGQITALGFAYLIVVVIIIVAFPIITHYLEQLFPAEPRLSGHLNATSVNKAVGEDLPEQTAELLNSTPAKEGYASMTVYNISQNATNKR